MRKSTPAQLALIDLPAPPRRDDAARRRAQAAMNARHCAALLAALERVPAPTEAPRPLSANEELRARQLAEIYDAWERSAVVAEVEAAELARLAGDRPVARRA